MSGSQSSFQSRASAALSWLILLGGIVTIGVAAHTIVIAYSSLPFSDGWTQISVVAYGENPFSLAWLWRQHNEHRLVIPKLFLATDLRLFRATQVFLLSSIFAIQFLHWMLLAWSMSGLGGWRGSLWRSGAGLAAFCLFCPSQWENLLWGFQTCFVLPGLFATLSFVGLLLYRIASQRPDRQYGWGFLVLSIAGALGATYSLANGNLLWPLLTVAALLLRLGRPAVLTYLVTGAISTVLYIHNYFRPGHHANPVSSLRSPLKLVEFIAAYFGSSWVRRDIGWAVCFGIAGLAIAFVFLWRLGRSARGTQVFSVQIALTLLFCMGTGFLTALGRLNFGIMQGFVSRYQTVALLFWCCLGLLVLAASAAGTLRVSVVIVELFLLVVLLRGANLARYPVRESRWHGFQLNAAAAALLTGTDDREQFYLAALDPEYQKREVEFLRKNRLSIFSDDASSQLGAPLDSVFRVVSSDECVGALQSVSAVKDSGVQALKIMGWAWDRTHHEPPSRIVAAADGTIVGLGAIGEWRPTIRAANPYLKSSFIGFTGYVKDVPQSIPLKIYAIFRVRPPEACCITTMGSSEMDTIRQNK
jgi:hypothetical protein